MALGGGAHLLHQAYRIKDCAWRGALVPKASLHMFLPIVWRAEQVLEDASGLALEDPESEDRILVQHYNQVLSTHYRYSGTICEQV
jgi:hypothetical protein